MNRVTPCYQHQQRFIRADGHLVEFECNFPNYLSGGNHFYNAMLSYLPAPK